MVQLQASRMMIEAALAIKSMISATGDRTSDQLSNMLVMNGIGVVIVRTSIA